MSPIKIVAAGIVGAVAALAMWLLAAVVLPIFGALAAAPSSGSGGMGAVVAGSAPVLATALAGFVVGCYWQLHRSRRRAR
jgi:hypothetical protein